METAQEVVQTTQNIGKGLTLTKKVALSIERAILSNIKYYDTDTKIITLEVEDEDGGYETVTFPASRYDNWINREIVVPETKKTLKDMVIEARKKRREIREQKEIEERISQSEKTLDALLKLPIEYTRVDRELKRDKEGKIREVKRFVSKDISAPLVSAKVKGLTFALERLKPERYGRKDETKNTHIVGVFSLADLRQKRNNDDVSE